VDEVIIIPVSAIVPTANRSQILRATLSSLVQQNVRPAEIIVVDASDLDKNITAIEITDGVEIRELNIVYLRAAQKGAAGQRNQGVAAAKHDFILFCDDDILFEPFCIERLWRAIHFKDNIGGVNAMITNQRYYPPGKLTSIMYRIMSGKKLKTYAGKCIGPAWNLLPQDDDDLPELVEVEWLNTTCTLYKREVLPEPVFPSVFKGYSLMEDLALSLIVGRRFKLYNARTARIFHDSQPGEHKNNAFAQARMELVNRHYVMTYVLGRKTLNNYFKLILFQFFGLFTSLGSAQGREKFFLAIGGKIAAVCDMMKGGTNR